MPPSRVPATDPPKESDINKCTATLALFTSDVRVRDAFIKCFERSSAADLGQFVGLLRQDLGYGESHFVPEQYPYIFGLQPNTDPAPVVSAAPVEQPRKDQ